LIEFLATVPLCQVTLPRAELPRIAAVVEQAEWRPGSIVIEEGDVLPGMCVIMSGEASVVVINEDDEEQESAILRRGDYWGGRALQKEITAEWTIRSKGSESLRALILTRQKLERLGLKMKIPKRPAMYEGKWKDDAANRIHSGQKPSAEDLPTLNVSGLPSSGRIAQQAQTLDEDEAAFCVETMKECFHLRALLGCDEEKLKQVVATAVRREVSEGTVIARGGETGSEFFVIAEGSFDILPAMVTKKRHLNRSAEGVVSCERLAQRMAMKQQFLAQLNETMKKAGQNDHDGWKTQSMKVPAYRRMFSTSQKTSTLATKNSSEDLPLRRRSKKRLQTEAVGLRSALMQLRDRAYSNVRDGTPSAAKKDGGALRVGDRVTVASHVEGAPKGVGRVVQVPRQGQVTVEFPMPVCRYQFDKENLVVVEEMIKAGSLERGSTWGELSCLYNARYLATVRASEDSVVYVMNRQDMKSLRRDCPKIKEYARLLEQVPVLSSLIQIERLELARSATGLVTFQPGDLVLGAGVIRADPMWYIIDSGSCTVSTIGEDGSVNELGERVRGQHIGERSILRGDAASEFMAKAGPGGMTALAISGEILKSLRCMSPEFQSQCGDDNLGTLPSLDLDAASYHRRLNEMQAVEQSPRAIVELPAASLRPVTKLGEGAFGAVFLVESDYTPGKTYALKRMSLAHIQEQDLMGQVRAERDILSMIKSPFIVGFVRSFKDDAYVYMLMEPATGGHLLMLMSEHLEVLLKDKPRGTSAAFYVACVALALGYLHDRHVAYRDLKLENVLLDSKGYAKLCDMGFARFVLGKTRTFLGTPDYMAPELIDPPHAHDTAVDWWALGVLTFELLVGQGPWEVEEEDHDNPWAHLFTIRECQTRGCPSHLIPSSLHLPRDFVKKLLTVNIRHRLGTRKESAEVTGHAWFRALKFDFQALIAERLPSPFTPPPLECDEPLEPESLFTRGRACTVHTARGRLETEFSEF